MGQDRKYTDETVEAICALLERGIPIRHVCGMVGITPPTFYRWLQEKPEFNLRVSAAQGKFVSTHVNIITRAALEGDARNSQWLLERRCPQDFGPNQQITVDANVKHDGIDPSMRAEIREKLIAALKKEKASEAKN